MLCYTSYQKLQVSEWPRYKEWLAAACGCAYGCEQRVSMSSIASTLELTGLPLVSAAVGAADQQSPSCSLSPTKSPEQNANISFILFVSLCSEKEPLFRVA